MANELQPLSLLFQNRLFRIPDYQRGYAWQQSQLVDFWDDLNNLQMDRYHYTGLLSLKLLKSKETMTWGNDLWMVDKGFKPCHIVDGQQRLTTSIILLNEIVCFVCSLDENAGKSDDDIVLGYETIKDIKAKYICQKRPPQNMITTYIFGYETDNPSDKYLRYRVFNEPNSGEVNETYYTKNLKTAKEFFANNIAALYAEEGIDGLNRMYQKLTQKLMFNLHEIDDDYDVFVAFETMNNRGKRLTNLELLKNRLIYLTTIYNDDKIDEKDKAELRKQINEAWKEVYYQLGRNKAVALSDDDFLRAHWIIYYSYSRQKGDDYIRFFADEANSGWNTKNFYFYEIVNNAGKNLHMQLALSGNNLPDNLRNISNRIIQHFPTRGKKPDWEWKCPFVTPYTDIPEDMSDEEIYSVLDDQYDQLMGFESKLVSILQDESNDTPD